MTDDKRDCLWCGKVLVRKENETLRNWEKRIYCDKKHAGLHSSSKRKPIKRHVSLFFSPLYI